MFHFPRFPFASYEFTGRRIRHYPDWVSPFGHLRVNGCLPPHRSLSQAATSFIGMFCRAIHQYTLNALHSLIVDDALDVIMVSKFSILFAIFNCESSEKSAQEASALTLRIGQVRNNL
jgi:hypothetical protein